MKARVDRNACEAHAICEGLCPQVFKVIGETSVVQVDEVPKDAEEACREVRDNCPTGAITIEDQPVRGVIARTG